MTPFVEDVSRWAVIVFYLVAFGMCTVAAIHTRLWARRVSTLALGTATIYWLWFYLFRANADLSTAPRLVLDSRVGQYIVATAIFIAALLIRRSDKEGVAIVMSRQNGETH